MLASCSVLLSWNFNIHPCILPHMHHQCSAGKPTNREPKPPPPFSLARQHSWHRQPPDKTSHRSWRLRLPESSPGHAFSVAVSGWVSRDCPPADPKSSPVPGSARDSRWLLEKLVLLCTSPSWDHGGSSCGLHLPVWSSFVDRRRDTSEEERR